MRKQKFKVGDKVRVVKIIGSTEKEKNIGKTFLIKKCDGRYGYCYGLDNGDGYYYSEEELELVKQETRTYTGVELLQAIKDGVFKNGDRFDWLDSHNNESSERSATIIDNLFYGVSLVSNSGQNLSLSTIINSSFKPIKKDPINLAKENRVFTEQVKINVFDTCELVDVDVEIKNNMIKVTLPSGISGIAKCCPEDKFDEYKGVKIATTRAIKKQLINDCDKTLKELCK